MTRKAVLLALSVLLLVAGPAKSGVPARLPDYRATTFDYISIPLTHESSLSVIYRDFPTSAWKRMEAPIPSLPVPIPLVTVRTVPVSVANPSSVETVSQAKAWARTLLGPAQYLCLDSTFEHESHWRTLAKNKYSGAYGIPQALPGSKMAWAGSDWRTNPLTQVRWGVHYITVRYGSACSAWSFWQAHRWY